jgi:hypothetical protein
MHIDLKSKPALEIHSGYVYIYALLNGKHKTKGTAMGKNHEVRSKLQHFGASRSPICPGKEPIFYQTEKVNPVAMYLYLEALDLNL